MRFFLSKLSFFSQKTVSTSPLVNLLEDSRPFWFSTQMPWFRHLEDTCLQSIERFGALQQQAKLNLDSWQAQPIEYSEAKVNVVNEDMFVMARKMAKNRGVAPALCILSSAHFPGGLALPENGCRNGHGAQEEQSYYQTTLAYEIDRQLQRILAGNSSYLHYSDAHRDMIYHHEMTRCLMAKVAMAPEQKRIVIGITGQKTSAPLYFVPMNKTHVCFKTPLFLREDSFEESSRRSTMIADPGFSYNPLKKEDIFPFHPLLSAAVEPSDMPGGVYDWGKPQFVATYRREMERRITAQLHTLILHGHRNVVFSAFGCGTFTGRPKLVAQIYAHAIEPLAHCFDNLCFAISPQDYSDNNYQIFHQTLEGLPLSSPQEHSINTDFTA